MRSRESTVCRVPDASPSSLGAQRRGRWRPNASPLIDAARSGDTEALRALLKEGVDVNAAEADGTTALHWASYRDDLESADLLIRAGAKVNAANDLGATPLWTASLNGSAAMVRRLLQAGAESEPGAAAGETPLMVASRSGNPDVVEQLLAKGAGVNARGARGQTALMWAVGAETSGRRQGAARARRRRPCPIGRLEPGDGRAAARAPRVQPRDPARGRHGADVCGARRRSRVGAAAGGRRRQRQRRGCVGRQRHGAGRALRLCATSSSSCSTRAPTRTRRRRALPRCTRRSCAGTSRWWRALLAHGADPNAPLRTWTPTRRSSSGLQFRSGAGRRDAVLAGGPIHRPARHAAAGEARRRSACSCIVPTITATDRFDRRTQATTALMAAVGMGGGRAWIRPDRDQPRSAGPRGRQAGRRAWRRRQCRQHRRPHGARRRQGAVPRAGRQGSPREGGQARERRQIELTPYPVASARNRLRVKYS